jgi:hypothetical protein
MKGNPVEELEVVMERRCGQYDSMALTFLDLMATNENPQNVLVELMMGAYRDGGRDMHKIISETLNPLWDAAGIKP